MTQSKFKFGYRVLYYITLFGLFFEFFAYPVYAMATHFPYGMSSAYYIPFIRSDFKSLHNPDSLVFEELENTDAGKNKIQTKDRQEQIYVSHKAAVSKSNREELLEFFSEDSSGIIGYNNSGNSDDPSDNIFKLHIDKAQLSGKELQLRYEVYGIENTSGVARSINAHNATGGYFVQKNTDWKSVEETISINQLKQGENYVLFTAFENQKIDYKIKNVRITALPQENIQWISLADQGVLYVKDDKAYVKGNVSHSSAKLYINNQYVPVRNHEFETVLDNAADLNNLNLKLVKADGTILYQEDVLIQSVKEVSNFVSYKSPEILIPVRQAEDKTYGFALSDVDLAVTKEHYEKADQITVQKLRNIDLAPLGTNIINVTNQRVGYRFLPDGAQFKEPAKLTLTYDAKLLPKGYDERDVKVLYFDMQQRRWLAVQTDTIIKEEQKIVALTDHFTDYIAGVIQAPESPETNSFTPTSISDIQVANPTANIMQIQPPTANQKGDGTLDFPITVPAGRGGLQPNLSVSYNNNGSSGIVGYGWDIAIPYISVDTKFGVPAYDSSRETESYLLNGEELLLKNGNDLYLPHRSSTTINRVSNATFYPKVEGSFSKIERIGTSPTNYYWIVWDKSGTKYYYGQSTNSRLGSGSNSGNIGKWMLEKVEDKNGNYILYKYFTLEHNSGVFVGGKEIRPISIEYALHPLQNSFTHKIDFKYQDSRSDKFFSNRLGFKEVNSSLLNEINVYNLWDAQGDHDYEYRIDYFFNYSSGVFDKELLMSIETKNTRRNRNDNQIVEDSYTHDFEYYNDVQNGLFGSEKLIQLYDDFTNEKHSALSSTIESYKTHEFNAGGGISPIANPPAWWPFSYGGTINFGFPSGVSYQSSPTMLLLDIDGDGLDDKVMKIGGEIKYRKNLGGVMFSSQLYKAYNIDNLSLFENFTKTSKEHSISLFGANVQASKSRSNSRVRTFLSDVNGDGLIDYIKDRIVYFNRMDPNSGLPTFTDNSDLTPNRIFKEGDVDPGVSPPLPNLDIDNDLMDIVKVWVAPKDGVVNIKGVISKQFTSSDNGVRFSIEKSGRNFNHIYLDPSEWDPTISTVPWNPSSPLTPIGSDPLYINQNNSDYLIPPSLLITNSQTTNLSSINVKKGEHVYFRVNSSQFPKELVRVHWDPEVIYINGDYDSPNNNKQYSSKYGDSFVFGNISSEPFIVTENGVYQLSWNSFTINNTTSYPELTDDVEILIHGYRLQTEADDTVTKQPLAGNSGTLLYKKMIKRNILNSIQGLTLPVFTFNSIDGNNPQSYVYFEIEVISTSYINWKIFDNKFAPILKSFTDNTVKHIVPKYKVYNTQLTNYYKSTFLNNDLIRIPHDFNLQNCTQDICNDRYIYLVVKDQYGKIPNSSTILPAKFRYKINSNGNVIEIRQFDGDNFSINPGNHSMLYALRGTSLYFEYYTDDYSVASRIKSYQDSNLLLLNSVGEGAQSSGTNNGLYKANIFYSNELTGLGTLYGNWGQFAYKGAKPDENFVPINKSYISKLAIAGVSSTTAPSQQEIDAMNNLIGLDISDIEYDFTTEQFIAGGVAVDLNQNQIDALLHFTMLSSDRANLAWSSHAKLFAGSNAMCPYFRFDDEGNIPMLPIPSPTNIGSFGAVSIVKESSSSSESLGKGISFFGFSIGDTSSSGKSRQINDFMDVNGDGYPDIIGDKIQLTSYRGGLTNSFIYKNLLGEHTNNGYGKAAGGSPAHIMPSFNSSGRISGVKVGTNTTFGASFGGSKFETISRPDGIMVDLNGDGLADLLKNSGYVEFNTSRSFDTSQWNGYGEARLSSTISKSVNASFGGSITHFTESVQPNGETKGRASSNLDLSAGFSGSRSVTQDVNDFVDFNGDGLPDYIKDKKIYFNTGTYHMGSGFSIPKLSESSSVAHGETINASILIPFSIPFLGIIIKAGGGGGKSWIKNFNEESVSFRDFDGDGYLDIVTSASETELKVNFSKIARTNMLKMVHNPTGSKIELDYADHNVVSGTNFGPNYKMPFKKWVLSKVKVYDGFNGDGEDVQQYAFEYENGLKDRRERKFLGFGKVLSYQLKKDGSIYRTIISEYLLNEMRSFEIFLQGSASDSRKYQYIGNLLRKESVLDGAKRLLNSSEYDYVFYSLSGAVNQSSFNTNTQTNFSYTDTSRILPLIKRNKTLTRHYNGSSMSSFLDDVNSSLFETYDKYGNVIKYFDETDFNSVNINYHELNSSTQYLVNIPSIHNVNNAQRYSTTGIDQRGNIIKINRHKAFGITNEIAETDLEYDILGNLTKVIQPKPSMSSTNSDRMFYSYEYDTYFKQYVAKIQDAYGYQSETKYNGFGQPVKQKDVNNVIFEYLYDATRRLETFKGPYNSEWTIQNEYKKDSNTGLYYALTKHNIKDEILAPGTQILYTSSFADGLGRIIQTKKQLELDDSNCNPLPNPGDGYRFAVSGSQIYDEFGRVTDSYLGQEELDCSANFFTGLESFTPLQHVIAERTTFSYDAQDRITQQHVYGLNATTKYEYSPGTDGFGIRRNAEKIILPEGGGSISYKDTKGRVITTQQDDTQTGQTLLTIYQYNNLGELMIATDAQGESTLYEYDGFGQKTTTVHPDNGMSSFTYDLTGKIKKFSNQNLLNQGQEIIYDYTFNQLNSITYPSHTVQYNYGAPGSTFNRAGRLTSIIDLTGSKSMTYGALGEMISENRTVKNQNGNWLTFYTNYRYDSWGRIMEMTYPDGENLEYEYNSVGQLRAIRNTLGEEYLKDVKYNFFDQPTYIEYGNEVVTINDYDITQRIRSMQLDRPDNTTLMRNVYSYDRNQNITSITNDYSQHPTLLIGGLFKKQYEYDGFNRLKHAHGEWNGGDSESHSYSLDMEYNETHGIINKNQYHHISSPPFSGESEHSYQSHYHYNNPQHPHAVTEINYLNGNANFEYDANGNMIHYYMHNPVNTFDREMIWDEQNRLMAVIDDGGKQVSHYVYDHAGERTFKSEGAISMVNVAGQNIYSVLDFNEYLIYPSGNMVVNTSRDEYSKHYYINNKRFASRLENGVNQFEYQFLQANSTSANNEPTITKSEADELLGLKEATGVQNVSYGISIGNTPDNCNEQLETIRINYVNNNYPPHASLQHCIDYIDTIRLQHNACTALILVNEYICEPRNLDDPGNTPDETPEPDLPSWKEQLDCLTELNILIAEYTNKSRLKNLNDFSKTTTAAAMQTLSFTDDDINRAHCCQNYQNTGIWECPEYPDMTLLDCAELTEEQKTDEWAECLEDCMTSTIEGNGCLQHYYQTGEWLTDCYYWVVTCKECSEYAYIEEIDFVLGEGGDEEEKESIRVCLETYGVKDESNYQCWEHYYATGKWLYECELLLREWGCVNGPETEQDCYTEALRYINENLQFEPELNACEVYEFVRGHFNCSENQSGTLDPIPDTPGDLPDDWTDKGGNPNFQGDGPYNEALRKPIWWYHTDHLGSSTYLTDNFGRPSHYYETLPFGEMMVEHNQSANNPTNAGYNNAYKFNGKELDDATGMYYYGARYYDPRISIFVSVDPLAEQFAGWTPYHYVHQNPINLIDPTGMSAEKGDGGVKEWWNKVSNKVISFFSSSTEPVPSGDEGTVLDEITVSANRKPSFWNRMGFSKDKFSNDWKNIKERSGGNHFVKESGKIYDHINNFGGLIIYGKSSYNMGGNDIKGRHTYLNHDDIGLFTGGGAALSKANNFFKGVDRVQTAIGGFLGSFSLTERIENNYDGSSNTSDSIFTVKGTARGEGFYIKDFSTRTDAEKARAEFEKRGLININTTGKKNKK